MNASPYPRPIPMTRTMFRSILRCVEVRNLTINSIDYRKLSVKKIIESTVWSNLLNNFAEFKIMKVTVHIIPASSVNTPGFCALHVADDGEDNFDEKKLKFHQIASLQGTIVRKVFMPMARSWVPTEPDDRNWRQFSNDSWGVLVMAIATDSMIAQDGASNNVKFDVMIDLDIKARGNGVWTASLTLEPGWDIPSSDSIDGFDAIDIVSP